MRTYINIEIATGRCAPIPIPSPIHSLPQPIAIRKLPNLAGAASLMLQSAPISLPQQTKPNNFLYPNIILYGASGFTHKSQHIENPLKLILEPRDLNIPKYLSFPFKYI